ncbi:hypothetical protein DFJ63DRAFT_250552 [Scheffersomyces coipomensis]|uniref:uncharacterized protein n=1 Tax=Scheffersomyces coipomensis TaxID=1788519 RepID=UPI00315D6AD7
MSRETLLRSLGDSHCHLDVNCSNDDIDQLAQLFNSPHFVVNNRINYFHIMTTYHLDLQLLDRLLNQLNDNIVVPYFGVHPWYSHLFTTVKYDVNDNDNIKQLHYNSVLNPPPSPELLQILPDPINLDDHINNIETLITTYQSKFTYGIGEIGLDKLFRVPMNGYFGNQMYPNNGDIKLSPCKVTIDHQLKVFELQLSLANRLHKQISVHCVKAHGLLFDTIPKYTNISNIILHSFSGSIDQGIRWINQYKSNNQQRLYFSFSNWINGADNKRDLLQNLIPKLNQNQILIETDISIDRFLLQKSTMATQDEYFQHLIDIYTKICHIRDWKPYEMNDSILQNLTHSII